MSEEEKIRAWASYVQNAAQPHIVPADAARRIAVALIANSDAELLARIQQLEERTAQAAELVSKAVGMMAQREDMIDPRQTVHLASGYRLDAIGAMKGVDLPRQGIEPDYDYRNRLLARLYEWRGPAHDGPIGTP